MTFLDKYTPVAGSEGENKITLADATVQSLVVPSGASAATISAAGGKALYRVNGLDPTPTFGRPVPDGDEIILVNYEMLINCRLIAESGSVSVYVQFYMNG